MKKLIYTAFTALLALTYSCQNSDWKRGETGDFYYQITATDNSSPKLDFGDLVRYRFSLYRAGKLLKNSYPNLDSLIIPPRDYRNILEQALVLCRVGDSIAIKFAYKDLQNYLPQYQNEIKPSEELIFGLKIHSLVSRATLETAQNEQFVQEKGFETIETMQQERKLILDKAASHLKQLELYAQNGLSAQNVRINEGMNNNIPEQQYTAQAGDTVAVYYALAIQPEGQVFDQNLQTADRFLFVINQDFAILRGFDQAAQQLKIGEAAYFFIDSQFAYGAEGSLPVVKPNQNLALFMKMVAIWKLKK